MSQLNRSILVCAALLSIICGSCQKRMGDVPAGGGETVRGSKHDLLTGRKFLPEGDREGRGYGLYSYLLFSQPVNTGNRDLYEAVLSAYLRIEEARRFEEAGAERKDLNVTYLPLRNTAPQKVSVGWLLDHYDYARAQIILRAAGNPTSAGPYIASYIEPLTATGAIDPGKLLLQDLSGVPADLAFLWIQEFIVQVRQPQYWDTNTIRQFMLTLRKNIAVIARAFGEVRSAQADIKSLFESKIRTQE